jgi:phage FluMu protein Com
VKFSGTGHDKKEDKEGEANMLKEFRCKFCHRLLAKVGEGSKVEIKCPKCKTMNLYDEETVIVYEIPENNVTKKIIERGMVKYDILNN